MLGGERLVGICYELKSNWENKLYIGVCTREDKGNVGWRKMGALRLKYVKGNNEQGMCLTWKDVTAH
jgi:hypothetical protein